MATGLLVRGQEVLANGRAIASEIVHGRWLRRLGKADVPVATPEDAARWGGAPHNLTLRAHYRTDTAGTERRMRATVRHSGVSERSAIWRL